MERDKRFTKGLATGILVTAIVFSIIFSVKIATLDSVNSNSGQSGKNTELSGDSNVSDKVSIISSLIDQYSLNEADKDKMIQGIYKGVVSGLEDPYSVYYTEEEYDSMMESTSGVYTGIGVLISQDKETGVISVVKPFANGPGYEAGLLPGDILYSVEGKEVTGVDSSKVVSWIKGKEGTKVKIQVIREGEDDYLDFAVERRKVEVPTVEHKMMDNKVGYIAVSEFDQVTSDQFKDAVDELIADGMKGLVIDLRGNPGGIYDVVVEMLDYILPKGLVVYTEDKNGDGDKQYSDNEHQLKIPYSVIINGSSASASEIFAGAVKDYGFGKVVGTTSYGKGVVQRIFPLNDGSAVKLTISKYFTPSGYDIDENGGIKPDVEVELPDKVKNSVVIDEKDDTQLQKAIEVLGLE
ncbi:MAG TPA: S41 family peptidase [Candidatus Pelethocola excrementipullorum]|nr:S41 family peptidase [Candidatus Pelethocola excrementipullorum]